MADPTIRQIKDDVLTELSMLGGIDTQIYAEDKLAILIRKRFNVIFKMRFWDKHCGEAITVNLSTTTGLPIQDMTDDARVPTEEFTDIQWIMRTNEAKPLPRIPTTFNPSMVHRPGFLPVSDTTQLFKLLPVGDASCYVRARRHTVDWEDDEEIVPFDRDAMVGGVCFDYLNGLGINPAEEDKFLNQFGQRIQALTFAEDNHEHYAGSFGASYNTDWQEVS